MIFITLMLPAEVRIFPTAGSDRQPENAFFRQRRSDATADGVRYRHFPVSSVLL